MMSFSEFKTFFSGVLTRIRPLLPHKKSIFVTGKVIHGNGEGKTLGYPTANLELTEQLRMTYGVYACRGHVGKNEFTGILHFGPRVIFGETKPQFEVHIFDFTGNVYGKMMTVEIRDFIRGTQNFPSVNEMVHQIDLDVEKAKILLR
jgi:riboflavin kinase / FMN adenylyltransferase